MVKTHVTWKTEPSAEATVAIDNKITEMSNEDKTDGILTKIPLDNNDQYIGERTWVDLESAQEWLDFIVQMSPAEALIVE
jgi:hypothetical protein